MEAKSPEVSSRLDQIVKKHVAPRRLSVDVLLGGGGGGGGLGAHVGSPPPHAHAGSADSGSAASTLRRVTSALSATLATPVDVTQLCRHRTLLDQTTLRCAACAADLRAFEALRADCAAVDDEWRRAKRALSALAEKAQTAAQDLIHLHTRIDALELKASQSADASRSLKAAVVVETGRVLDEIEQRLELQSIRDKLVEEIEDKTQELFEKANGLVADEAKRRFGSQTRVRVLEGELDDLEGQLAMERMQLSELRAKMEELRLEKERLDSEDAENAPESTLSTHESSSDFEVSVVSEYEYKPSLARSVVDEVESVSVVHQHPPSSEASTIPAAIARPRITGSPQPDQNHHMEMDQQLLSDLHIFMKECGPLKLNKLHTLPFLKTCLEEDVLPCLKFGGNPRTNTKKLVDAILVNMCFVEEMNATQIAANKEYHSILKKSLDVQAEYAARSSAISVGSTPSSSTTATPNASPSKPTIQQANQALLLANTSTRDSPTHQLFTKSVLQTLSGWTSSTPTTVPPSIILNGCPTCGLSPTPTPHHFKISDMPGDKWIPICNVCRNRLVAVCEFYNFVRHLKLGLYSTRGDGEVYGEVVGLRIRMWEARCGGGFAGVGSVGMKEKSMGASLRPDSVLFLGLKNE
ncbi:hypothetical protein BDR26DRAFT_1007825 [Obelidium mucronatum]|nr:hypothetical protein BDR26DRAFT_1007825 [Obelidium mucronatum]